MWEKTGEEQASISVFHVDVVQAQLGAPAAFPLRHDGLCPKLWAKTAFAWLGSIKVLSQQQEKGLKTTKWMLLNKITFIRIIVIKYTCVLYKVWMKEFHH